MTDSCEVIVNSVSSAISVYTISMRDQLEMSVTELVLSAQICIHGQVRC